MKKILLATSVLVALMNGCGGSSGGSSNSTSGKINDNLDNTSTNNEFNLLNKEYKSMAKKEGQSAAYNYHKDIPFHKNVYGSFEKYLEEKCSIYLDPAMYYGEYDYDKEKYKNICLSFGKEEAKKY